MPKIHCLNNISKYGTDLLGSEYVLTDEMAEANGILVRSAAMHDMEFSEDLLAIARCGAGVNNIPLDRAAEEGIVVFNTPGANANAVKELVLCGMLLASRDIIGGVQWCRDNADDPNIGKSAEKAKKAFAGNEILGKKLGVIGLGAIGALVANAAVDLGMDVYGYDPFVSVDGAWQLSSQVHHVTRLEDLYSQCEFITIHVPALKDTIGMINAEACAAMPEGAVVLNFSRDTLVDAAAMTEALASGKLAHYVTDFATPEVMQMTNAIVLPHLGASTAEAEDNCAMMAARELMAYIEQGNIFNSVNYPNCDQGPVPEGCSRVALLHKNVPNMIGKISGAFGDVDANIANMTNKARGEHAYTLIDVDGEIPAAILEMFQNMDAVYRVRTF